MAATMPRVILALAIALCVAACGDGGGPSASGEAAPPAQGPAVGEAVTAPAPADALPVQPYAPGAVAEVGGACSLDLINGVPEMSVTAAAGSAVMFAGWAVDASSAVPTDAQFVLTDGDRRYATPITAGFERPDVMTALGNEAARLSGFNALVSLAGVEPGEYGLSIVQGTQSPHECQLEKRIVVSGT